MTTIHPEMVGTEAAKCEACRELTLGVAEDCAWMNMVGVEGVDPFDYDTAIAWARSYVEAGTVSAYYCDRHDPINADYWATRS